MTRNVKASAEDCHEAPALSARRKRREEADYSGFFSDFIFSMCGVMATANLSTSSLATSKVPNMELLLDQSHFRSEPVYVCFVVTPCADSRWNGSAPGGVDDLEDLL